MQSYRACAAVIAAVALAACGGGGQKQSQPAPERAQALVNPSDFPLYPGSVVTTVVRVDSSQMRAAMRASDPHASLPQNFRGHEIIAETPATLTQLAAWLAKLRTSPPRGLREAEREGWTIDSRGRDGRRINGGAKFESPDGRRGVYVVVADPHAIRESMGPAFALMDSYNAVPGMLRGPIDDQAKKQIGYSVTELLDAKSPVGAAIATLKRLQNANRRAILVIDETTRS